MPISEIDSKISLCFETSFFDDPEEDGVSSGELLSFSDISNMYVGDIKEYKNKDGKSIITLRIVEKDQFKVKIMIEEIYTDKNIKRKSIRNLIINF